MTKQYSQIKMEKVRNSSIEILRIIAMIFIVLSHACVHSNIIYISAPITFNKLFAQWGVLGNLGVDIYLIISGYFLCRKSQNLQSIIRLMIQVWFYSYLLFFICYFGFQHPYSFKDILRVVLPTIFEEYWFFTAYAVLNLLCPYINYFLSKIDQKMHRNLLILMFGLWIIIPTFTRQMMYSCSLSQLLFFYCIGAYFRLYPADLKNHRIGILCITGISFILLFSSTFVLDFLGQSIPLFQNQGILFYGKESLLIVGCAVGLFMFFISLPSFSNTLINAVASCTFGVYLIHDNPAVRHILWTRIFRLADRFNSSDLIVYIIISVLIVFCASTCIEYIRIKLFGNGINRVSSLIAEKINKLKDRMNRFITF